MGRGAWQVALYEWNKDFLASEKCEQRLVADNSCQGRCTLAKQLQPKSTEAPSPHWKPSFVEFYYLSLLPTAIQQQSPLSLSSAIGREALLRASQFEPHPPFVPPRA